MPAAKARGRHVAHVDEIADELPGRDADALRRRASELELDLIARASKKDTRGAVPRLTRRPRRRPTSRQRPWRPPRRRMRHPSGGHQRQCAA